MVKKGKSWASSPVLGGNKDIDLSDAVLEKLKSSFDTFDKLTQEKRIDMYGDKELVWQFRDHFKKMYPNLLAQIDRDDLPVYLEALEKKGFSLGNLRKDTKLLAEEFGESEPELKVIKSSISDLKKFCADSINKIPANIFADFATEAIFNPATLDVDSTSKIKTVDDLWKLWKQFAQTKMIVVDGQNVRLADYHDASFSKILCPEYNPTERIVVQIAIQKLKKNLSAALKADFDLVFTSPIDAHSSMTSLMSFKTAWETFLSTHVLDEALIKKLNNIVVTNGDIKNEFIKSGHSFEASASFSQWENRFKKIFNKLATRQLFEEVRDTTEAVEKYVDNISDAFVQFPPYVNQIFKKYPYNHKAIIASNPGLDNELSAIDSQINNLDAQIATETDKEKKKELQKKKKEIKKQKEMRRWQAYASRLASKDATLGGVISKLSQNNFDFNKLDSVQQQEILNVLVKSKLQDLVKNKVPELLGIDEAEFGKFVQDLFDLNKKQILIPTKTGKFPINFESKSFISSDLSRFFSVDNLWELENLPLNFKVKIDESNRDFFEKSPLFSYLFQDFDSKAWTEKISDSYKVRIKKWDKITEWYLSAYPPVDMDELLKSGKFPKKRNADGEEEKDNTKLDMSDYMFLYSSPVSSADENRNLILDTKGNPVFFAKDNESDYEIEVLDKKLNLSGKSINSLLMSYVLWQDSMNKDLSSVTEKKLWEKFKNLKWFQDVANHEKDEEVNVDAGKEENEKKEKSDYEKCIGEREKIKWYKFPNNTKEQIDPKWFVEWSSFLINFGDSLLPPETWSKFIKAEIIKIDKWTGKFKLKFAGWEAKLGKYEWHKQEFDLSADGMNQFKNMFDESNIYKLPDTKKYKWDLNSYLDILAQSGLESQVKNSFSNLKWDGNNFKFSSGDHVNQEVEYFGWYESKVWEVDQESWSMILYKIKNNPDGTINVSNGTGFTTSKGENWKYSKDMDYDTFVAFIGSKALQPKSKEQAEAIKKKNYEWPDSGSKDKIPFFSINNIVSFVKNIPGKVKDGIKKYDEEKTEDLTDIIVQKGWLYKKLAALIPSDRMSSAFAGMDTEYNADRDNRIWKKIDKRVKIYEWDPHFATQYKKVFEWMITGEVVPGNSYKLAAMLLAMISKWKWPYNRNSEMVGKWLWIRSIFGADHQARYLKIREMKQRDLQEKAPIYGQLWADQTMNELVELEMKYIVHVADGRQMAFDPAKWDEERYLASKWSRQFAGKLDEYAWAHFKKSAVEEGYGKVPPTTNFEFARFEYFRLIAERPVQAIPYLKVMAEKAISDRDWKIFEQWVVVGMLSGVFLYMVQSDVKWFIQKICRTRWFLPGLLVRDMNQQTKLIRLLDIASCWKFSSETKYDINNFSMWNMDGIGGKWWPKSLMKLILEYKDWSTISKFFELTGKNDDWKTLIEIYNDPKISRDDKMLLWELIWRSNEKDEELDPNVKYNSYALTGSVLTKSQSVVDELIRFEGSEFKWKDKDTIQAMQEFWSEVAKSIPSSKQGPSIVEFYLKKFDNRFGARWFSDNERSVFIKRLVAIKDCPNSKEAEDMLRYTIVWTITARSGSGWVPTQLLAGLNAFKNFFKANLDTILDKNMVEKTMWIQYRDDVDVPFKVWNWSDYVEVADRDVYQSTLFSASPDERKILSKKKSGFASPKYINKDLYELAQKLERNFWVPNRFKNYYQEKTDTKKDLTSVLTSNRGVRVKNKEVLGKIKEVLENKNNPNYNSTNWEIIMDDYNDNEYYEE